LGELFAGVGVVVGGTDGSATFGVGAVLAPPTAGTGATGVAGTAGASVVAVGAASKMLWLRSVRDAMIAKINDVTKKQTATIVVVFVMAFFVDEADANDPMPPPVPKPNPPPSERWIKINPINASVKIK
jgi:hypothetical protein